MFEARLIEGNTLKLIIDAVQGLVTDTNIDCTEEEVGIQCMDSAHVALVAISLSAAAFEDYRCDRALSLGVNATNLAKIFKMMGKQDILTLKAEDEPDNLTLMFESANNDSVSDFELKLMEIDAEQMQIPDMEYKCNVKMPSGEFQRIVRDLQALSDACTVSVTKEGIRFSASGDIGTGNILVRQNTSDEKECNHTVIEMEEPVELQFALRYLNFFAKATPISGSVNICLSPSVPISVEYPIEEIGYVKFFLAPKIEDEDEEEENDQ